MKQRTSDRVFNCCIFFLCTRPQPCPSLTGALCPLPKGRSRIPRRRGCKSSRSGTIAYKFARFSEKLCEVKKILVHKGAHAGSTPPPGSALLPLDIFKLVHYEARTVRKRVVGIRLKCLLVLPACLCLIPLTMCVCVCVCVPQGKALGRLN